jgi:hypothetical protein
VTLNVAPDPLKATAVAPVKFVPEIVTLVPTGPLAGEKLAMVGGGVWGTARSPPSQPIRVNAGVSVSMPTSPVGYEPSVVKVNCEMPLRKTSSVFPSAVNRHLSPETRRAGVKVRIGLKLPSGLTL